MYITYKKDKKLQPSFYNISLIKRKAQNYKKTQIIAKQRKDSFLLFLRIIKSILMDKFLKYLSLRKQACTFFLHFTGLFSVISDSLRIFLDDCFYVFFPF